MKPEYYIGIDPDTEKSGFAIWCPKDKTLELHTKSFAEIVIELELWLVPIEVVIEAGWLNQKSSWHKSKNMATASKIGKNVGANHQVGKCIAELCIAKSISHRLVKPTAQKKNHYTFCKITGYKGRTNQEKRDAGILVFGL